MTAMEISCLCVAGVGLLIILIAIPFFSRARALKKNCTETTTGIVIKHRIGGSDNGRSVAPVVEYCVNGKKYRAYRHYRGVVAVKKITPKMNELFGQNDGFYISKNDRFHLNATGVYHNYREMGERVWPKGSELPVVYNPEKPKQGFVEKVVVISDIVGFVLTGVGAGLLLLSVLIFMLIG
jgi:hypothetical protein